MLGPGRAGRHSTDALNLAASCFLGGALGHRPQRPCCSHCEPQPVPAAPRIIQSRGMGERSGSWRAPAWGCAFAGSLRRHGGRNQAGPGRRARSPAASPPDLPSGPSRWSLAGKGGLGDPMWLHLFTGAKAPHPIQATSLRGEYSPGLQSRKGERWAGSCHRGAQVSAQPAAGGGGAVTHL